LVNIISARWPFSTTIFMMSGIKQHVDQAACSRATVPCPPSAQMLTMAR